MHGILFNFSILSGAYGLYLFRYRVESRIADSICKNTTLIKVGLKFQFGEVYDRVMNHLIDNIDRRRKDRVKNEGPSQVKWKPSASTIG